MDNNPHKSIHDEVLTKIKSGTVFMRPRWHFVLKTILAFLGFVLLLLLLLYLASFVVFILYQSGVWFVPAFGFYGMFVALRSLPWLLIFVGILFVGALEILVRRYSFAYRKPLLYSLLGVVGFVMLATVAVAKTGIHEGFFLRAREDRLPLAGKLYRGYGLQKDKNIQPGVIKEIIDEGFTMENKEGKMITVTIDSDTRFPLGMDFEKGDKVVVLGEDDGKGDAEKIKAHGIRRIDKKKIKMRHKGWFRPFLNSRPKN